MLSKLYKGIITAAVIIVAAYLVISFLTAPEDNKYSLTSPNGLKFGVIKGYENWPVISSHYRTDSNEIRFLLGNDKMISAYKEGSGKNGNPFPEGAIAVQIGYSVKQNPAFKNATEPAILQRVEYMIKDSRRFNDTGGWGYASFTYDANTSTFKPFGMNATFANVCFACHLIVKEKDYIFTDYAAR